MSQSDQRNEPAPEVGYAKPPKSGQFQKGRSGNPKGRPRSTSRGCVATPNDHELPTQALIRSEAQRPIARSDGGPQIPAIAAVVRVQYQQALKGHRLPAKWLIEHNERAEARAQKAAEDNFQFWSDHIEKVTPLVRGRTQPYWPSQDIRPHLDDIRLGPGLAVSASGPVTPSLATWFDLFVELRDVWLQIDAYQAPALKKRLRREEVEVRSKLPRYARMPTRDAEERLSAALVVSLMYDAVLPRRFQLDAAARQATQAAAQATAPKRLAGQIRATFKRLGLDAPEPLSAGKFVLLAHVGEVMQLIRRAVSEATTIEL